MLRYIMKAKQTNGIYHLIKEKDGKFKELFEYREISEFCTNDELEAKEAFKYMHPSAKEIKE